MFAIVVYVNNSHTNTHPNKYTTLQISKAPLNTVKALMAGTISGVLWWVVMMCQHFNE